MKERKEGKKRMEKRKSNVKRGKGVLFGIPSVNLKYNDVEQFACSRNLQARLMSMCRCRVKPCSTCNHCLRCHCDHDGLSIEEKISCERDGFRTKDGSSDPPRKKRRILPSNRVPRRQKPVFLSGKEEIKVDDMNDAETASPMRAIISLGDLFAAFQLNKSSSLRKLLSAADLRSNIINWKEE
jgi:hypothetical protein